MPSQVMLGMCLVEVVLSTISRETRPLLETQANFFAHPDPLLSICDQKDPRNRTVQLVRGTSQPFTREGLGLDVKKPFSPILGGLSQHHKAFSATVKGTQR